MARAKRFMQVLSLCIGILAITIPTYGAIYTATISGLTDALQVQTAEIWIPVADDFNLISFTQGTSYPISIPGWDYSPSPPAVQDDAVYGRVFKFGIYDWSLLAPVAPVPLTDGTLFSIEYSGGLTPLNGGTDYISFFDASNAQLFPNTIALVSSDISGASFNAVPIPPTILLLGAGLVGLVGIRRRVKS